MKNKVRRFIWAFRWRYIQLRWARQDRKRARIEGPKQLRWRVEDLEAAYKEQEWSLDQDFQAIGDLQVELMDVQDDISVLRLRLNDLEAAEAERSAAEWEAKEVQDESLDYSVLDAYEFHELYQ